MYTAARAEMAGGVFAAAVTLTLFKMAILELSAVQLGLAWVRKGLAVAFVATGVTGVVAKALAAAMAIESRFGVEFANVRLLAMVLFKPPAVQLGLAWVGKGLAVFMLSSGTEERVLSASAVAKVHSCRGGVI